MVTRPSASRDTTSGATGAGGPSIDDPSWVNAGDAVATPASHRMSRTARKGLPIPRMGVCRISRGALRTKFVGLPVSGIGKL